MTVGYAVGLAIRRLGGGALAGFVAMVVIGVWMQRVDMLPPEPAATRYATWIFLGVGSIVAIIGLKAGKIAVMILPLFLAGSGSVIMLEEILRTSPTADLNGDGLFTIRDLVSKFFRIVFSTGSYALGGEQSQLSQKIATFFETPLWVIDIPMKLVATVFWWGFGVFGLTIMIVKFQPSDLRNDTE